MVIVQGQMQNTDVISCTSAKMSEEFLLETSKRKQTALLS